MSKRTGLDVVGKMFGKWKVLSNLWKNNIHYCTCVCTECNKTIRDVMYKNLRRGLSSSCGCKRESRRTYHAGEKYGRLYIIKDVFDNKTHYCDCYCDCETDKLEKDKTIIRVLWSDIRNGSTQSCGCYHKEKTSESSIKDLTGMTFGYLTVMYRNGSTKDGNAVWHCKCNGKDGKCNKEKDIPSPYLMQGKVSSCGCKAKERKVFNDLSGKTFGKLYVIEPVFYPNEIKYKCQCSCENKTICYISANNLRSGHTKSCGCLSVSVTGSLHENEIKDYIISLSGITGSKINMLGENKRKQIDLFYDTLKVGIEYNGSMFHATLNGTYKNKEKHYHYDKFIECKNNGIHLINIFDVDWFYRKEKVKTILSDIFTERKTISSDFCNIEKIDKQVSDNFCDVYHIHNHSVNGNICYGLYYDNILYSVMAFSRKKNSKKSDGFYELVRYCELPNYFIEGGASKLLNGFEIEYSPKHIVTFVDNDFFTGDIYSNIGFIDRGLAYIPFYWFFDTGNKEVLQSECKLSVLKEKYVDLYNIACTNRNIKNKSDFIMSSLGALKIYRSGVTKFDKIYSY